MYSHTNYIGQKKGFSKNGKKIKKHLYEKWEKLMKKYISIIDCPLCRNMEQKKCINLEGEEKIPDEIENLIDIYEIEDIPHSYAVSINILKLCPFCGTYYHYTRHKDDGEHFMDPSYDNVYISRLTPYMVMASHNENIKEPEELKNRYDEITIPLIWAIKKPQELNWHIKKYITETLTDYYLLNDNWKDLKSLLLSNDDPVIRVETATDLLHITREEYPVWSTRNFNKELKKAGKKHISRKKRWPEIVMVFDNILRSPEGESYYCHIDGYYKFSTRIRAIEGLGSMAYRKIDITPSVETLLKLFSTDKYLNKRLWQNLYWYIKQKKENAVKILEEIEELKIDKNLEFVRELMEDCNKTLKRK